MQPTQPRLEEETRKALKNLYTKLSEQEIQIKTQEYLNKGYATIVITVHQYSGNAQDLEELLKIAEPLTTRRSSGRGSAALNTVASLRLEKEVNKFIMHKTWERLQESHNNIIDPYKKAIIETINESLSTYTQTIQHTLKSSGNLDTLLATLVQPRALGERVSGSKPSGREFLAKVINKIPNNENEKNLILGFLSIDTRDPSNEHLDVKKNQIDWTRAEALRDVFQGKKELKLESGRRVIANDPDIPDVHPSSTSRHHMETIDMAQPHILTTENSSPNGQQAIKEEEQKSNKSSNTPNPSPR